MGNRFVVKQDWNVYGTVFKKNTQFMILMGVVYMDGMVLAQSWQAKIKQAIKNDIANGSKYIWEDRCDF